MVSHDKQTRRSQHIPLTPLFPTLQIDEPPTPSHTKARISKRQFRSNRGYRRQFLPAILPDQLPRPLDGWPRVILRWRIWPPAANDIILCRRRWPFLSLTKTFVPAPTTLTACLTRLFDDRQDGARAASPICAGATDGQGSVVSLIVDHAIALCARGRFCFRDYTVICVAADHMLAIAVGTPTRSAQGIGSAIAGAGDPFG